MPTRKSLTLTSAIFLALGATTAQAATVLEMNASEEAAQFEAAGRASLFSSSGLELGGGYLTSDDHGSETSAGYIYLGFYDRTRDYDQGFTYRWTQYDTDYGDGGALGIGAYRYYYLSAVPRLSLGGSIYYMPPMITTQDVEFGVEVGVRARYEVMDNIDMYIGYRHTEMDFDDHDGYTTLDSGPLAGFRLIF